ncbi:nuclease-related domain-containing protein [Salinibacterium sp. TMP30]|uniref:nuclease-related domain-containing protein n=1 Tax=Salinibacterium sp. TMP30 TaxID=3138237 RepID=UPI00313A1EF6
MIDNSVSTQPAAPVAVTVPALPAESAPVPVQAPFPGTLEDRPAAYSVIAELLRVQADVAPRSTVRRVFGASPLQADAESWFSGAHGELKVGELLSRLGSEWRVLHAVPVGTGDSDIDHVVFGPAGVFTINTKRHRGQKIWVGERMLMVAGHKTDHLRNSRYEAKRAAKLLTAATGIPVEVHPILAIVDPASFTVKRRPNDVSIMVARELPRWLKRRKPVLDAETVQRISVAAVDSRTWHRTANLTIDPAYLERFSALDREVSQARIVRLLWGVVVVIALGFVAVAYLLPTLTATLVAAITGA